jgi:hypothetical protein
MRLIAPVPTGSNRSRVSPGMLRPGCTACSSTGLTLVDTAFPATWPLLLKAIASLGRSPSDVQAVVPTHGHFDHLGVASRTRRECDVPVLAHVEERFIAAHPYRYAHERSRLMYPLRHTASIPVLTAMAAAGALRVPRIRGVSALEPGDTLITLDPYTGGTAPQIVIRQWNRWTSSPAPGRESCFPVTASLFTAGCVRFVLHGFGRDWLERRCGGEDQATGRWLQTGIHSPVARPRTGRLTHCCSASSISRLCKQGVMVGTSCRRSCRSHGLRSGVAAIDQQRTSFSLKA